MPISSNWQHIKGQFLKVDAGLGGGSTEIFSAGDLSEKQLLANELLQGPAKHILLRGGARSGKTFLICRALVCRAIKAPGSTHAIFRKHLNHLHASIIDDTMPKVLHECFHGMTTRLIKNPYYYMEIGDSRILYGGLDDKDRTERILGQEHSTVYLNEVSQITYAARNKAVTRLAQKKGLVNKVYYDCNPPSMGHWSYALFMEKIDPITRKAVINPDAYATMQINPRDNLKHQGADFITELESLPEKDRRRFLDGEFLPQVEGALWTYDGIQRQKGWADEEERDELMRGMRRIVVAIDPSGCTGPEDTRSDEIGIVVAGIDYKENGYVLEDLSGHYSPEQWAKVACDAYDNWSADVIVGEINYGGDMVRATIAAQRDDVNFEKVTASRGKHVRAEPIASLYSQKRVSHVERLLDGQTQRFVDLEDQLCIFSAAGYQDERSPDRADAAIFALTELMLDTRPGRMTSSFVKGY